MLKLSLRKVSMGSATPAAATGASVPKMPFRSFSPTAFPRTMKLQLGQYVVPDPVVVTPGDAYPILF